MVLVTGEVGAGKTFVGNMLSARLGVGCQTVMMSNPAQSGKQLIGGLARRLGITVRLAADKARLTEEIEQYVIRIHARGRLVAVIVDEAQDLSPASLEELRLLWNWEQGGQRLVQIVLIGQPELRKRLLEPKWESLRQRVVLSYHLKHLSAEDTPLYIAHRLRVAAPEGGCLAEFTPAATTEIHAATDGVPRLINVLCDNALLVGYAKGIHALDTPIIAEVLQDMTCWGLRPAGPGAQPAAIPAGAEE
jgi:general secretion pathway protein A